MDLVLKEGKSYKRCMRNPFKRDEELEESHVSKSLEAKVMKETDSTLDIKRKPKNGGFWIARSSWRWIWGALSTIHIELLRRNVKLELGKWP